MDRLFERVHPAARWIRRQVGRRRRLLIMLAMNIFLLGWAGLYSLHHATAGEYIAGDPEHRIRTVSYEFEAGLSPKDYSLPVGANWIAWHLTSEADVKVLLYINEAFAFDVRTRDWSENMTGAIRLSIASYSGNATQCSLTVQWDVFVVPWQEYGLIEFVANDIMTFGMFAVLVVDIFVLLLIRSDRHET